MAEHCANVVKALHNGPVRNAQTLTVLTSLLDNSTIPDPFDAAP